MMSADWLFGTAFVVIGKLALTAPAATVTLGGTVAAALLSLERETTKPPVGAAAVSVAVPVDGSPPTTSFGLTRIDDSVGGEDACLTVQRASVTVAGAAEPSFTSTVQSAGAENGSRSILKLPAPSLVPIATPSTVIVRFATAMPSRRNCVPFSSARETRTSADAGEAPRVAPTRSSALIRTRRLMRSDSRLVLAGQYARSRETDFRVDRARPAGWADGV